MEQVHEFESRIKRLERQLHDRSTEPPENSPTPADSVGPGSPGHASAATGMSQADGGTAMGLPRHEATLFPDLPTWTETKAPSVLPFNHQSGQSSAFQGSGLEMALATFENTDSLQPSPSRPVPTPPQPLPAASLHQSVENVLEFDYTEAPNLLPANGTTDSLLRHTDQVQASHAAHGTLLIGSRGRSKYLGPTAASEWLKDQERQTGESRAPSRLPSPELQTDQLSPFPFESRSGTRALLDRLPDRGEASRFVDCYFRYFAWQHRIIEKETLFGILERIYASLGFHTPRIDHHDLALLFVVLAMGALHDLELPVNDPIALEYMSAARQCLSRGDFLQRHTISAVQALTLLAHCQLETEQGRNGDSAWLLWGMVMRLNIAMGLHRDGERWGLEERVAEERRKLFWECHGTDIMQANCFSRPASLAPHHVDTALPRDLDDMGRPTLSPSFHTLKTRLAEISGCCLDRSLNVNDGGYDEVSRLQERLESFERNVPFEMRCRAAYQCLPSLCPDPVQAEAQTPEVNKRKIAMTLQQYTLAINISEAMLFLNRLYYARALSETEREPSLSRYGKPYLVVVERCNVITQLVSSLHSLLPAVTVRIWWLWYHVFNVAVCLATLVLRSPQNTLAGFVTQQLAATLTLMRKVAQSNSSKRLQDNLEWLEKLQLRINERISQAATGVVENPISPEDQTMDEGLLGWRTRLVQKAQGQPMELPATPLTAGSSFMTAIQPQQMDTSIGMEAASTERMLHQFWDPMLAQNGSDAFDLNMPANWWSLYQP